MIRLDDETVAPGGTPILAHVGLQLDAGDHVGLVGRNGAGKTTVLRAIVGELSSDGGRVEVRPGTRIAWLPQQAVSGATFGDEIALITQHYPRVGCAHKATGLAGPT